VGRAFLARGARSSVVVASAGAPGGERDSPKTVESAPAANEWDGFGQTRRRCSKSIARAEVHSVRALTGKDRMASTGIGEERAKARPRVSQRGELRRRPIRVKAREKSFAIVRLTQPMGAVGHWPLGRGLPSLPMPGIRGRRKSPTG
jgi:hypothetical protein